MSIQSVFGSLIGKTSHKILSHMGRGTTLPGKLALKLDPHILNKLAKDYDIIVVTGTNGKTVTTALCVGILNEAYDEVVTNVSGANMLTGITTTFLASNSKSGKKLAVLEVDEASLSRICDDITPILFIFTNIFRDQMDRYGEIYTTYNMLLEALKKAPDATILANGDSPIFHAKELTNPVYYYGFEQEKGNLSPAHYNTEGVLCPKCDHVLQYYSQTYANLGDYICPSCGFHRPELTYSVSHINEMTHVASEFTIADKRYRLNIGGLYNIYNALAAIAAATYLGISQEQIAIGFEKNKAVFGRQESFTIGDTTCTLILIKNPVGASQAIEMVGLSPFNFSLSVLLNANYADGIDPSWIWDANFEAITKMSIRQIYAGGERSDEIARRLEVTGIGADKIAITKSLEVLYETLKNSPDVHAYILATYTAMLDFRELLAKHHIVNKEMH